MNSDFGADIFGGDEPPPPPSKHGPRRPSRPQPAAATPPERKREPEPEPAPRPPRAEREPREREPRHEPREREPRQPEPREREPRQPEPPEREARQHEPRERAPRQPEPRQPRPEPVQQRPTEGDAPRRERDDDDERRPRRRRRRGRGSEGRGEERDERLPGRTEPPSRPVPRAEHPPRDQSPGRQVASQRLAVFVDADRLASQASRHDGEIAFRRLLQQLANGRPLVRAVAYVAADQQSMNAALSAQGLDVEPSAGATAAAVAMAVDAMAVASRVDCIVLVPGSPEFGPLVRALRTLGVRVEAAGFDEPEDGGIDGPARYHRLGRESLFVP